MSTGIWAACALVIVVLNKYRSASIPEVATALAAAQWAVFWLLVVSLLVLMITGGFFLSYKKENMRYRQESSGADEVAHPMRLVMIKHLLFAVIYGGGTVWVWFLIK